MDSIVIEGGKPLKGIINISGSKNACLPIMAAAILTKETLELSNVPKLSDIATMQLLLKNHGLQINSLQQNDSLILKIDCRNIDNFTAPYDIVRKMRASIWVLGPLLARYGKAKVSLPGGCAIGARLVNLHIDVLRALGADITINDGYIYANVQGKLQGTDFCFKKVSVGATINAILAAVLAEGESNFSGCAMEPEIVDLCHCLNKMGAKITSIGTTELKIIGVDSLNAVSYKIIPDRIEAGTYMIAAAITQGDVLIANINYDAVSCLGEKLKKAGYIIQVNGDSVRVKMGSGAIKAVDISTAPYPKFPTDLQAQFMSLMTLCHGSATITENIFENRFMHVPELCRMGADISVEGNRAVISGVNHLTGAEVMASDLRASASLIIAGLAAKGKTTVRRVYHLDRGYQSLEKKLAACGAKIERLHERA